MFNVVKTVAAENIFQVATRSENPVKFDIYIDGAFEGDLDLCEFWADAVLKSDNGDDLDPELVQEMIVDHYFVGIQQAIEALPGFSVDTSNKVNYDSEDPRFYVDHAEFFGYYSGGEK